MYANDAIPELIFDDPGLRGPKGESGDAPTLNVQKVAPYLYTIEYKDWDYLYATLYAEELAGIHANCSAVINGSIIGHNYDDEYDERADFIVRTTATKGRHASIGMASVPSYLYASIIDGGAEGDDVDKGYDILPFMLVDGINDAGVACVMNSVPNDYGRTTGTNPDGDDIPEFCLVRYVLDYAGSVEEAIDVLGDINIYMPESDELKSEFYLLISDGTRCVRIEFIDNDILCTELTNEAIIAGTNFLLHDYDGTNESLQPHANGVERYNILASGFESANTDDGMIELLKSVRYTKKYDSTIDPFWFSDYRKDWTPNGWIDVTKDTPIGDYELPVVYSIDKFNNRQRDGATSQTIHTAVYNRGMKCLTVLAQENDQKHRFAMDFMPFIEGEIQRAEDAEEDIRQELRNGYYTKRETDAAISGSEAQILQTVADGYYSEDEIDAFMNDIGQAIDNAHDVIMDETAELLAGKMNIPGNDGEDGQILVKTSGGHAWGNAPRALPDVTAEDNDKIMVVENGEWVLSDKFADYIRYINLAVNITSDNGGVCHGGLVITVKNGDTDELINSHEFTGQPITFRVPRGLHYVVEQSGAWEGYHNPHPDYIDGVATTDATLIFTYEAIKVPETLRELEIIVDSGSASSLKDHIGLQFDDVYTENETDYNIIWDLKDVIPVVGEDGEQHTGVVLEWHTATPSAIPFDAPEKLAVDPVETPVVEEGMYYYGASGTTYKLLQVNTGDALPFSSYDAIYVNEIKSTDGSVVRRGYGKYADSAVRKWLNGDSADWFTPSHIGDVAPSQAADMVGFKCGCSEQILRMAKPVEVITAEYGNGYDRVIDTFFIPSVTEVYGANDNVTEGVAWKDWIDATGFDLPDNKACNGRKVYMTGAISAQEIGLRTANVGYQYIVWDIKPDGSIDGYTNASTQRRYTPCCVIYK